MTALPAAVLWDMDGTIIDTEPHWMEAETQLIASYGGSWSHEEALSLVGQGLWHSARVLQSRGVALTEDEIIDSLTETVMEKLRTTGLPWRPGARELLLQRLNDAAGCFAGVVPALEGHDQNPTCRET